jgi:hypothetical protein
MDSTQPLVDDLQRARAELLDALDLVDAASMTEPGLVGRWSGRELIAHLGYWAGHAVEVIHAAEEGRAAEFNTTDLPVDEVNETVARVARETDLATVRKREAASVEALVERLRRMDPGLLGVRLGDGSTLEEGIREDASDHYRKHAEELRGALGGRPS